MPAGRAGEQQERHAAATSLPLVATLPRSRMMVADSVPDQPDGEQADLNERIHEDQEQVTDDLEQVTDETNNGTH